TNVNRLVRLNVDGSLDMTFNTGFGSGANNTIRAVAIQNDGRILLGGSFTNVNGFSANRVARLNADGSMDTNFVTRVAPGANDTVQGIAIQEDNRILLVGQFTSASGVTRNGITRLLSTAATDPSI